jgi:hypothetical protein
METYEEFKLKVLKKGSDLYLKHDNHPPILCLHTGEGKNVLLPIPPSLFENKEYKDIVPSAITEILKQTKAKYLGVIMNCTITPMDMKNLDKILDDSEIGIRLKNKLKRLQKGTDKDPDFDTEEHKLLMDKLGEDRLIFIFQGKYNDDSFYSFIREESGKLKPSLNSDNKEPMGGCFSNLFQK